MKDVVSVSNPGHRETFGVIVVFHHRHQVGGGLAGVVLGGQGVDHRDLGVFGKGRHVLVAKTAVGDAAKKPREHLGGVADGFRGPELDVVFEERQCAAAESLNANFKGNTGSRGRLFVDGTDGHGVERKEVQRHFIALLPQSFEFDGPLQNALKIVVHIVNGEKVLHHAVSTARRLLSVVRSVLFVLNVGCKTVSCVAHAAKQGLGEGQDVGQAFLKF